MIQQWSPSPGPRGHLLMGRIFSCAQQKWSMHGGTNQTLCVHEGVFGVRAEEEGV